MTADIHVTGANIGLYFSLHTKRTKATLNP
jgi:hypothetical protein